MEAKKIKMTTRERIARVDAMFYDMVKIRETYISRVPFGKKIKRLDKPVQGLFEQMQRLREQVKTKRVKAQTMEDFQTEINALRRDVLLRIQGPSSIYPRRKRMRH